MKMLRAHAQEAAAVFLRAMRYQSINNACYATTMLIGLTVTSMCPMQIKEFEVGIISMKAIRRSCKNAGKQEVRLF